MQIDFKGVSTYTLVETIRLNTEAIQISVLSEVTSWKLTETIENSDYPAAAAQHMILLDALIAARQEVAQHTLGAMREVMERGELEFTEAQLAGMQYFVDTYQVRL